MTRKPRTLTPWRQERIEAVRRALAHPEPPPRDERDKAEAEAARTERRQVRFGPRTGGA